MTPVSTNTPSVPVLGRSCLEKTKRIRRKNFRSRYDQIAEMLSCCVSGPIPKTRVMYGCSLSYPELSANIDYLISHGLMEWVRSGVMYRNLLTTEKGRRYLSTYSTLNELLGDPEKIRAIAEKRMVVEQ